MPITIIISRNHLRGSVAYASERGRRVAPLVAEITVVSRVQGQRSESCLVLGVGLPRIGGAACLFSERDSYKSRCYVCGVAAKLGKWLSLHWICGHVTGGSAAGNKIDKADANRQIDDGIAKRRSGTKLSR